MFKCRPVLWINWIFLPHDAMHKHGLCHRAVSVRPTVRPSVCSCILWKRVIISSNFFHRRVAISFRFFSIKPCGNIPTGLHNGAVECGDVKTRFLPISRFISKIRAIATIKRQYELLCDLPNSAIFNYLERPLTQTLRSRIIWRWISQKWYERCQLR